MEVDVQLELPTGPHHEIEVGILVDGGAHPRVVVGELVLGHLGENTKHYYLPHG